MRIERLTPAHVRRAIQVYLDVAWPPDAPQRPRVRVEDFADCETLEELFTRFEQPRADGGPTANRYALRLGNARYPFMKLVVWEYLVASEYFFSVDTHDDLDIRPGMPDYEGWMEIRRGNRELKERIEHAWSAAGLPTHEDLRELMEGIAELEQGDAKSQRILLVDDEQDVVRGVAAVLSARGYQVETAFDGAQVMTRLEHDPPPDLLVLDYSMPELDGQEVLRRLRESARWETLPVLIATARELAIERMPPATGYLRKPYPREVLFRMIQEMLAPPRRRRRRVDGSPGGGAPGNRAPDGT